MTATLADPVVGRYLDGRYRVDGHIARGGMAAVYRALDTRLEGTVAYLAPEQVQSARADPRTDVYAAGITLWETLIGAAPYAEDRPLTVAYRHVHDDVPRPATARGSPVPPALDDLVVRATRRDPAARPADAGAFLSELRALLATGTVTD